MRHILFTLILSFFVYGLSPAQNMAPISRTFNANMGDKLTMNLEIGGEIEIEAWDRTEISVEVTEGNGKSSQYDIQFEQSSTGLLIEAEYTTKHYRRSSNILFSLKVPKRYDVDVKTLGGKIQIHGLQGEFKGNTMGGQIFLSELKGEARISSMGGNIEVLDSELEGKVSTMGGNVMIKNVIGGLKGSTMGGNVRYLNAGQTQSRAQASSASRSNAIEPVRINSMGGDITLAEAPGGARVKTMGGDIELGQIQKFVVANTYGGKIHIKAIDGSVDAHTYAGDIFVQMVGDPDQGDRSVSLVSFSGDIELIVPKGMDMDVDIELAFTRNADRSFRIESDFELQMDATEEWVRKQGSTKKYLYARGKVGKGTHSLRIKTVNGNVILREE